MKIHRVIPRSFQWIFVFVILLGLVFPPGWVVSAQDVNPPEEPAASESSPGEETPAEPQDPAPPEEPAASSDEAGENLPEQDPEGNDAGDPAPTEAAPQEGSQPPGEGSEPPSETETGDISNEESVAETVQTLAENNLTLVDENGEPLSLTTEEAISLIETADPYFTAAGITYGWTNQGAPGSPVCHPSVTSGYCTFSSNPITDAIDSPSYTGQVLTIEGNANDYASTDVVISKTVNFRPRTDMTVNSITLNNGAVVNWTTSYGTQYYLTSLNVFVNEGAYLNDAMEVVASGGTVNLGDGTFNDDYSVNVNKSITITGNGPSNTIVKQKGPCLIPLFCSRYFIINANDVKINNLTLDGNSKLLTGIYMKNRTGIEISDMNLQGMLGQAVFVEDSSVDFLRNNFTFNTKGIFIDDLDPGDEVTMTHNRFFLNLLGINYNDAGGSDPFVNAAENWWGCNDGPNNFGCQYNHGTNRIDTSDFLMFEFQAEPNPIMVSEDSTLETFHYVSGDASKTPVAGLWWFNQPSIFLVGGPLGSLSGDLFTADTPGTQYFFTKYDLHPYWTDLLIEPFVCPEGTSEDDGVCVPVGGGGGGGPDDDDPAGPEGPFFPAGIGGLIPVTGGFTGLSCEVANTLVLENGDSVAFSDPLCGYQASLEREEGGSLPAPLPEGLTFVSGMTLTLQMDGETVTPLPAPVTGTAGFVIPEGAAGDNLVVLMWDPSANGGLGGWLELDSILAGQAGFTIPGTFVLASK